MCRKDSLTAPIMFQDLDGKYIKRGGVKGVPNTRQQFPQVCANLAQRWCSSYVKIDVGARLITSQERFLKGKYCVVTGERAQESSNRAKYNQFEPHRTDHRDGKRVVRWVDHYRPVHKWDEKDVWAILKRHGVQAHPCYHLVSRCSCMMCIFADKNQWSTIKQIAPDRFEKIAVYEEKWGKTIHRKLSVREQAEMGTAYEVDPYYVSLALSSEYEAPLVVDPNDWILPSGAFSKDVAGPPT